MTKGNTLKQGDKTPLKYRLFDADGEKLNIAGKSAKVRLVYPDFLTIGYEKDGLTVAQDDTVTFTIDGVIPSRIYHVEIIVDGKFIFPSRADESKFTVDKSSLGTEANIIEIVGVDQIVNKVLGKVDADIGQAITDITATNEAIQEAEEARKHDYSSKADYVDIVNESERGKNLFDKSKTTDGYLIDSKDGKTLLEIASWFCSDSIPVQGGEMIVRNTQGGVYQYDGSDNFIVGTVNGSGWEAPIKLTDNTKAIRLNGRIYEKDSLQVEYGTAPTSYEPYKEVKKTLVDDIKVTSANLEGIELGGDIEPLQAGEGIAIENNVIRSTVDVTTPIADLESRIDDIQIPITSIDERLKIIENQSDDTGGMGDKYYKVNSANNFTIFNKISESEYVGYNFTHTSGENYVRLWDLSIYKVAQGELVTKSENYENPSVSMKGTQTDNHYTDEIGSTVSKIFTGHKIEISTFVRQDGGIWSVDIDGVDYGTVSTWSHNSTYRTTVLADDLSNADHTLTLTFLGEDPEHPATTTDGTATTPRGWINYHTDGVTKYSFIIYSTVFGNNSLEKVSELAIGSSNKDFAFHVRPMGQETPLEFFPYHSGVSTTTATTQTLSIDGEEVDITTESPLTPFATGAFNQVLTCKLPTDTEERASVKISFVYDEPDRVEQFLEMKFNLDTNVYVGYVFMMPANAQYIDKVTTNVRESVTSLDSDIGVSKYFENPDVDGYRVTMKNGMEDYYIDAAVFNRSHSYDAFWLQNRDMTMRKVYPTVFRNTDLPAGTITYFDGYYKVGKMKNANLMV